MHVLVPQNASQELHGHHAVAERGDGAPGVLGDDAVECSGDGVGELLDVHATVQSCGVIQYRLPCFATLGLELFGGDVLVCAGIDLDQAVDDLGVHAQCVGEGSGGLACSTHGTGHDVVDLFFEQEPGDRLGLAMAQFGEPRVGVGVEAFDPFGASVANDDQIHGRIVGDCGSGPGVGHARDQTWHHRAMLSLDLSGRVAVVVGGGGGGIGTAMVDALAACGADVGAVTIDPGHAADTAERVRDAGRSVSTQVADVLDHAALIGALDAIASDLGVAAHLVNVVGGAGVDDWWRAREVPMDAYDRIMGRNVRYAMATCQWAASEMIAAGRGGAIVNVSSVATRAVPLLAPYGAAKAALEALGRTMAAEWGPHGIRVNAVAAGTVKTPRAGTQDLDAAARAIPTQRRGTPADIANAAVFLLSDLADNITGQTLVVDGGGSLGSAGEELPVFVTNPAVRSRFD